MAFVHAFQYLKKKLQTNEKCGEPTFEKRVFRHPDGQPLKKMFAVRAGLFCSNLHPNLELT